MNQHDELLIIEAGFSDKHYWENLWRFRGLLYVLAIKDVAVRYKQTVIGILWALIRPFMAMVIFTVVFGQIAGLSSATEIPYALVIFSALLPWQLFSSALIEGSNSLVSNGHLISKIYFPRMVIPAATLLVVFIDFLVSLLILVGLMFWYHFLPNWNLLFLPIFILMALLASFGLSLWLGALNVKYRDIRYAIPFLVQLGLYASPVGFSSSIVPDKWKVFYFLNPMVGIIDGFRWCILGGVKFNALSFGMSVSVITFFMYFGIAQFRAMEKKFSDLM